MVNLLAQAAINELDEIVKGFAVTPPQAVIILSDKKDSFIKFRVTDSGSGIDEETVAKLFDPFYTTKESSNGTGLGLCMVQGFVSQSGGSLTVNSESGVGSKFEMYLPRGEAPKE